MLLLAQTSNVARGGGGGGGGGGGRPARPHLMAKYWASLGILVISTSM